MKSDLIFSINGINGEHVLDLLCFFRSVIVTSYFPEFCCVCVCVYILNLYSCIILYMNISYIFIFFTLQIPPSHVNCTVFKHVIESFTLMRVALTFRCALNGTTIIKEFWLCELVNVSPHVVRPSHVAQRHYIRHKHALQSIASTCTFNDFFLCIKSDRIGPKGFVLYFFIDVACVSHMGA